MSFGGFDNRDAQPMAEINMTPLVDVMLVLLIIFMVTMPLMTKAIPIDLPQVAQAPADEEPEAIRLSLDAAGALYWEDEMIDASTLDARLAEAAARQLQPELRLAADKDTRFQPLAEVMAAVRGAGLSKLGFVTLSGDGHAAP
ncbi:MAG: biopolymer transporter ExbD [Pseudomonadota bacterium]